VGVVVVEDWAGEGRHEVELVVPPKGNPSVQFFFHNANVGFSTIQVRMSNMST